MYPEKIWDSLYLSRNPTGIAPAPTEEDKNFNANTINDITFALIKNSLYPNGASKFIADKKHANSIDVINPLQSHSERNNAVYLKQHRNQSAFLIANSLNLNSSNRKLIAVTTRKNPSKDTFKYHLKTLPRTQ